MQDKKPGVIFSITTAIVIVALFTTVDTAANARGKERQAPCHCLGGLPGYGEPADAPITGPATHRFAGPDGIMTARADGLSIKSTVVRHGKAIPAAYTADGADISLDLEFSNIPAGAKSLVLIMDDPDAPVGTWTHWVVYDIPANTTGMAANAGANGGRNLPPGARHGKNSWGSACYRGPSPPAGPVHRYFIRLYALDVATLSPAANNAKGIRDAMKGHVLANAKLVGTYQR